jgi:hypothetical protein
MEPIKFFNLQKNNKKTDTQPDYNVSFKTNDTFVIGGACWKKTDKNGNTFLCCKFSDAWKDHTDPKKTRKGYHIAEDGAVEASTETETDL